MAVNTDLAKLQLPSQAPQIHTHSINSSVVGFVPSECTDFLSRLPIIDVYLPRNKMYVDRGSGCVNACSNYTTSLCTVALQSLPGL
jgi:hypothetical protein